MAMDINWLSCGAALIERDGSGVIKECNSSFHNLVGSPEMIENVWEVLGVAEFVDETKETLVQSKWLSVRSMAVPGKGDKLFLEINDVTKRRDAESRAFNFLELSFDGFFDYRMADDYEYMSPRFWEMFGYAPEEKRHHPSEWQAIVFQEDLPALFAQLNQHVASRGAIPFRTECRYRHKNGSTVIVSCNGRVVEWAEDGSPLRMIGTHTDITELRQKQKLATENLINDYLAHMIRNPLTSAVGASQFLHAAMIQGTWDDPKMKQEVEKDLLDVHDNLMSVSSIVGRLAELHNIYNGKILFACSPANIAQDILEPTKEQLELLYSGHCSVRLEIVCDPELRANIDVLRVKQIFFGILEGATARMINMKDGIIRISAKPVGEDAPNEFLVEVEDTGPSITIDDDLLLGGASDGIQQSTSSGLHPSIYISRALARRMGGSLSIDKEYRSAVEGQGLRLVLRLPGLLSSEIDSAKEEAKESNVITEGPASIDNFYKNGRVLVIDDDRMVNKILTRRFTKLIPGVQVDCALSGEKGIELAKQKNYSLFIVDHYMPGPGRPLNGAETITQLRLLGITAPIIGCSANDVSAKHLQAGANSFIQKPVPKDQPLTVILNSIVPIAPTVRKRSRVS